MMRLKPGSWAALGVMALIMSLLGGCSSKHEVGQSPYTGTPETTTTTAPSRQGTPLVQADPSWFSCKVASDCQVERGVCNELQGVNRSFIIPFRDYRTKMSETVECARGVALNTASGPAQCIDDRCVVKVQHTGASPNSVLDEAERLDIQRLRKLHRSGH